MNEQSPELVVRAMRVRNRLPYYRSPYTEQPAFYAALCEAPAFEALPESYRQAILDAEADLNRARVHGRTRIRYWIGIAVVGLLFVVVVAYLVLVLAVAAFTPIPADAVEPPADFVPLGFIIGVAVAAGLERAWKALYYRLWPERERF